MHTDNGVPPFVLSGRVSCSSSGDRTIPLSRKSQMAWIWQHGKRTVDDNNILMNCGNMEQHALKNV